MTTPTWLSWDQLGPSWSPTLCSTMLHALLNASTPQIRKAPDASNFLRHVMRALLSVRPKCSHRCVSLKETPLKRVQILKHTTKNSTEQTAMRTKWFKHIAIETVQVHLLSKQGFCVKPRQTFHPKVRQKLCRGTFLRYIAGFLQCPQS